MTWHFEDAARVQALRSAAASWEKTPFAPFANAKGPHGGIDCVGYGEALLAASGIGDFNFPRTPQDYSRNVHNDKILNMLRGKHEDPQSAILAARFAEFPSGDDNAFTEPPMVGDLLVLKDGSDRTGLGVWHLPIMLTHRKFTHCAPRLGVSEGNIDDSTYRRLLVAHFRARSL